MGQIDRARLGLLSPERSEERERAGRGRLVMW
jgi:hypothetical protein